MIYLIYKNMLFEENEMKNKLFCLILATAVLLSVFSAVFAEENRILLDTMLKTDAAVFNNDLALIGADLSLITYDGAESVKNYLVNKFDFDAENIFSMNYDGSLAFTAALKDFDDCSLLLIAARGSKTEYELQMDAESDATITYKSYPVYDFINDFKNGIFEVIDESIDKSKAYKVFLCGHSLGGAAANLAAAQLIDGYGNDVYCYTFGAIDSIKADNPVKEGYEGIHNIYNDFDTFSPSQYGFLLSNGAGSKVGKFGSLDEFSYDFRSDDEREQTDLNQIVAAVNHSILNYRAALENGIVYNSLKNKAASPSEWAKDETDKAISKGFVPESLLETPKADITREDFVHMAVLFVAYNLGYEYGKFADLVNSRTDEVGFADSDNPYVLLAARIGITEGTGEGKFMPQGKITREQAATMLARTYMAYRANADLAQTIQYSDKDSISPWAQDGVRFCDYYGVMKGYETGAFGPKDNYTVEQSIVTFVRMSEIGQ